MTTPRILAIMGSGETAPTMKAPHRRIFERLGSDVDAVLLDTPFGFQENAPILAEKAIEYFRDAVGQTVAAAGLTRTDGDDTVAIERGIARVRAANWLFAGPGSPTYALAQWTGTAVPDAITEKLRSGGAVVFSSAAALTLGVATVPVYEIYKVGRDPHWLDGLDVLSEIGLHVAVIPHYDNAEGGNHDTRFCYLGERRLAMLEPSLPQGVFVLGIDEHTGIVMDLDADTAEIVGKGAVTLRGGGTSVRLESGQTIPLDTLRAGPQGAGGSSLRHQQHRGQTSV
jgi:cyanophycinase-like exopeptidase